MKHLLRLNADGIETCCFHCYVLPRSRLSHCAEAIVQLLSAEDVEGRKFSLVSKEGDGPGQDSDAWRQLFTRTYQ